jgi:hypothetical protein
MTPERRKKGYRVDSIFLSLIARQTSAPLILW